jgi:membrane associated rhomboid family serine protease
MRPASGGAQMSFPRPGKAVIVLLAVNVLAYVLELVLLRANVTFIEDLFLTPADVFERGYVWQTVTYWWLHRPDSPGHLLMNMLWLWMFGSQLEKWWGAKRFLIGYAVFAFGGSVLTLLIGLLSRTDLFAPIMGGFWTKAHLGASGAVMGVTIAWGLTFANQKMNFLFLGEMKGKTFLMIIVAIELLMALSFDPVSSTSHFGGMIAAWILCRGMWKPSKWSELFKRMGLERRRRKVESELRVIDGGKSTPPKNPRDWN